jgi:PHD/YefM family antitoxin component YafN of YafNO toxin-antitoxin module
MKVIDTPLEAHKILELIDQVEAEPVSLRFGDRTAVLISASEYERMKTLTPESLDVLSQRLSAQAQAQGLTFDKLQEILNEIHHELHV